MKINMLKNVVAISFIFAFMAIGATTIFAQPNLRVLPWQGSSTPLVESTYQYTSRVRNIGNQNADNVKVVVDFPLTNTSPSRFILGKLAGLQTGCSKIANKLECNVGTLLPNQTKSIAFTFEFQVSTTTPTFTSTATTTTAGEINPNNNSASISPARRYANNPLTTANVLVTSCTGTNLTSFYECELYPSSQQSFSMTLNLDKSITVPIAPTYTGMWDQLALPTDQTLHFTIGDSNTVEAEFNGFAVSSTCFEGITTFPGNSNYNSAYRVCEQ